MATIETIVKCPYRKSENVSKHGVNTGKQRYIYNNKECKHKTFYAEYKYKACNQEVREQVYKMAVDCTGTRATGRILGISKDTVLSLLKKMKIGLSL
jgi:transposase-like protein